MQNKQISKSENTFKDLTVNLNESLQKPELKSSLKSWIIGAGVLSAVFALYPEIILASSFDIDKGVNAGAKPLIDGVKAHWGKGILLSGVTTALWADGDGRQRGKAAVVGAGIGGVVILGLIGMFG